MAGTGRSYVPAELTGQHYRPIGGPYGSFELAVQAMEQHYQNRHGGPGSFHHYAPGGVRGRVTLVEVGSTNNDPLTIRTIYKIIEQGSDA